MLHYFAVILHAVVYMLVSFQGMQWPTLSVIAFPLQFRLKLVLILTYKLMFYLCGLAARFLKYGPFLRVFTVLCVHIYTCVSVEVFSLIWTVNLIVAFKIYKVYELNEMF
jgi:hypothetical protein